MHKVFTTADLKLNKKIVNESRKITIFYVNNYVNTKCFQTYLYKLVI